MGSRTVMWLGSQIHDSECWKPLKKHFISQSRHLHNLSSLHALHRLNNGPVLPVNTPIQPISLGCLYHASVLNLSKESNHINLSIDDHNSQTIKRSLQIWTCEHCEYIWLNSSSSHLDFLLSNQKWSGSNPLSAPVKRIRLKCRGLFYWDFIDEDSAWLGPEQRPGKTLGVIEKAEAGQNIPTTLTASTWRIICLAISSSTLRTACDVQWEFDYRVEVQIRSSLLTTWRLKKKE